MSFTKKNYPEKNFQTQETELSVFLMKKISYSNLQQEWWQKN